MYTNETFISTLTVADLKDLLKELNSAPNEETKRATGRLVYGLRGIRDLFHCSHKTAQFYKDHVINEAVSQNGRKIVVDADLALELFNQRKHA